MITFSVLREVEICVCGVWLQCAKAISSFCLSLASTKNILSFTSFALYSSILKRTFKNIKYTYTKISQVTSQLLFKSLNLFRCITNLSYMTACKPSFFRYWIVSLSLLSSPQQKIINPMSLTNLT